MLEKVLASYDVSTKGIIQPLGAGLINTTWLVKDQGQLYVLQKINTQIFKQPQYIASNIESIATFLSSHQTSYFFVSPVKSNAGETMIRLADEYYRLFPYIENSHTATVVNSPEMAYEAARQFGLFTKMLRLFPVDDLKVTLPDFHNLSLRYSQFEKACESGDQHRLREARKDVQYLFGQKQIVDKYNAIIANPNFKKRVTHHDTKISNVLFNEANKGICVIDLDTVMPGYFISDVGDMLRTYLCPVSEEEKDLDKIEIRHDYFEAVAAGYLEQMKDELTAEELHHFVYSGSFMIYMQALRFMTDHLNNDVYYGAAYEGQNLVRAQNQVRLLERMPPAPKRV